MTSTEGETTTERPRGRRDATEEEPPSEEEPSSEEEPTDPGQTGGGSTGGGSATPAQGGKPAKPGQDARAEGRTPAVAPAAPLVENAPAGPAQIDPEVDAPGVAETIWLHRDLADPTPPAKRLTPSFAHVLKHEAGRADVDWPVVLAALRAGGFDGGAMEATAVRDTAQELADLGARRSAWRAFLAYCGRTAFADRALALRTTTARRPPSARHGLRRLPGRHSSARC